ESHIRVLEFLEQEIAFVEGLIVDILNDCEYLTKARDLLVKEVAGLGKATATSLLALIAVMRKIIIIANAKIRDLRRDLKIS
ncbi:IS110 family transposase, partial [Francisella philomiragia]